MDSQQPDTKKVLLIISGFLFVILILLIATLTLFSNKAPQGPNQQMADVNPPDSQSQQGQALQTSQLPQAQFASWTSPTEKPNTPSTSRVYSLKQGYSLEEVTSLAQNLAAGDSVKQYDQTVLAHSFKNDGQDLSMLIFNTTTGEFTFTTSEGVPLNSSGSLESKVYEFLQSAFLGLNDTHVKVFANYKKRSEPGVTYVELHRDWGSVGLPILNLVGVLNLPEDQKLAELTLASTPSNLQEDVDIYNTSDSKDGFTRQADFNTITVGIENNSVISVKSNLRKLESNEPTETPLLSYEEAESKVQSGQADYFVTAPAGSGSADWGQIYPNNVANAREGVIDDSYLAYLENSPNTSQNQLSPYYFFKGHADLESGYRVNFTAAVSALGTNPQSKSPSIFGFGQVYAQDTTTGSVNTFTSQKQSTFEFASTGECLPAVSDLNPIYEVNGIKIGWSNIRLKGDGILTRSIGWWYYVPLNPGASFQADFNTLVNQFNSNVNQVDKWRKIDKATAEFQQKQGVCPVRVTGSSPTVFIYGNPGTILGLKPVGRTTYSDPLLENQWTVVLGRDGVLNLESVKRNYLYYEYVAPAYSRPAKGWVVAKSDLNNLSLKISQKLGLNGKESERLNFELNQAASRVDSSTLFVGLIDQKELNQKLPLYLSTLPEKLYRYHFYVTGTDKNLKVQSPILAEVLRSGLTVLELGASAQ